jgi:predicted O-methyltransferase YrrM
MEYSDLASLASGHVEARIIQAAVQLGIFDAIGDGSDSSRAVAAALHLEPRATEVLLNALAALELLEKNGERFSLAAVATQYLIRTSSHYLGGMILFDASLWNCWERLVDVVRSGKPARPANMYQDDERETEIFINAMDSLVKARGDADMVARVFDWEKITGLLDIGSGPATYPIQLCRKFPELRATIFDLPATLKITERYVREAGLEKRIRLVSGDYRTDSIGGNYDVVFMSNIIHGEGYDENRRLIAKLYSNLQAGGKIIIKDHILDETRIEPPVGAIFSLLMLLTTESGRCYSFEEIKSWLEQAGLSQVRQIDLPPPFTSSLVIGTK